MTHLEKLKQEETELLQRLRENRKTQKEIRRNIFSEKTGIKIGSLIEWPDGKIGFNNPNIPKMKNPPPPPPPSKSNDDKSDSNNKKQ